MGLSFWICVVIFLSFLCHFCVIFLSFICRFLVILLSFWERENGEKKCLKMTTMTDLLLSRGSTKYKEQVEKLLESQPAVKKDRAGELALGNSFLGLPGRGVVSRLRVQGRLKNRVGGRGWGEMARGGGSGPRSGADLETPKTQLYQHASQFVFHVFCIFFAFFFAFFSHFFACFCILFAFFCIFFAFPRLGVILVACFLHFPDWESFFWHFISQTGSHFLHFFAFPRPGLPPSPLAWSLWENDKKMNNARK